MATSPAVDRGGRGRLVPIPYRVVSACRDTADTHTIEIEPAGDERLDDFAPGQFAMLYAFGAGESPISVSGYDPSSGRVVHTIRAVGAVSAALCATAPGRQIGARGPYGVGWPLDAATDADVVLVAGGLGLPPLRPAVQHVLDRRDRYRGVSLLYGGRSPGELLYPTQVEQWRARSDIDVEVTVDSAGSDWAGRVGVVTKLIAGVELDPANAVAMIVGPEIMMRFAAAALLERGLSAERIYVSMERSMHCAVGTCGHCMLGPELICKDGPVLPYARVEPWLGVRRL